VFEEKTKWSLPDAVEPVSGAGGNYASVGPHMDAVKALFLAEAAAGWMEEIPVAVARERYGERLAIASLGVVEEKEKIRAIHDASHKVQVNHRIRVQDQLRYPSAGDLRTIMRERLAAGVRSFGIVGDVHKAHRRIKIRPEDWGLQACQLSPETVWLNRVGTYGLASAAYYWSRFGAAALVRLCYYLAGPGEQVEVLL